MSRVSVIIPAYNAAASIAAAIRSTLAQTAEEVELIVVDDGSTDETVQVVAEYGTDVRLHRRAVNGGPSAARNDGLRLATGTWIAFLDADDAWLPGGLHALLRGAEEHPQARIVQARFQDVWPHERGVPRHANRLPSALFHRTVFGTVGFFDETLRRSEDFDFWVRVRHHAIPMQRIAAVATLYHRRADLRPDRLETFYQTRLRTLQRHLAHFRRKRS